MLVTPLYRLLIHVYLYRLFMYIVYFTCRLLRRTNAIQLCGEKNKSNQIK